MADPVVQTQSGLVRGVIEKHEDGFNYYAFKGVPFAEPPIGELRFKDPIPAKNWKGVRDTKNYGPICAQYELIAKVTSDEENCLYLNVFTKAINEPNVKKAVMVWIHGGGFYFGCANDWFYGPEYLIRKDVVLVTVSYRLGVFGFLDLEDEVAPGNQGLKDQALALRWVQQNIHAFGGDSNNVTCFGESAGGAAVHFLTLSPMTKNLVHKAISQSGVAYCPWTGINTPKKNAIKLCSLLGKELEDSKAILEFLKTVDTKKLREAQERLRRAVGSFPFGPNVDVHSPNPFMPISPEIISDQGVQIPYLVGYTNREGIFFLLETPREEVLKMIDADFSRILSFRTQRTLNRYNLTKNQFRRLYYKSEKISEENLDTLIDFNSELLFIEGIHRFAKVQSERSSTSTYMYQFSYDPNDSFSKSIVTDDFKGASHFDELSYLFKMSIYDKIKHKHLKKGTQSYKIMDQMTELWTNFAKYGKPTITTSELIPVHWLPISDGTVIRYMNIDEDLTMQSTLNIEQKYLSAAGIKNQ